MKPTELTVKCASTAALIKDKLVWGEQMRNWCCPNFLSTFCMILSFKKSKKFVKLKINFQNFSSTFRFSPVQLSSIGENNKTTKIAKFRVVAMSD